MRFTLIALCVGFLSLLLAQTSASLQSRVLPHTSTPQKLSPAGDLVSATRLDSARASGAGSSAQLSPVDPARWMDQYKIYTSLKPLNQLVIPQTHDSGTYSLISTYNRPTNDPFAPDVDSEFTKIGSFSNIAEGWSKAQEKTVYQQLKDGIRSLDLRPCMEKNGTLRVCHGLYGPTLSEILKDIRKFADEYPNEIVIIAVGGFSQTKYGDMSAQNIQRVKDLINAELGPRLVNHNLVTPTTPIHEIWFYNRGKSLIAVFDHDNSSGFWGKDKKSGSWKDVPGLWNKDVKKSILQESLNTAPADRLFYFSGPATPDANMIGLAFLPNNPKNLVDVAAVTNPVIQGWLKNEWAKKRVNIISADFYNRSCLVNLALHLNGIPQASLEGCNIGDNGAWSSWRDSKPCPAGFRDDGAYCAKPTTYGRGAGYPWQFGDPLNDSGMFKRCGDANGGSGNCEKYDLIVYPKCKPGYSADGCCLCRYSAPCPSGMTDIGVSCKK